MKKKLQFKWISFLMILSLVVLETILGFWMKSYYDNIRSQTENKIYNAMKMADYKEMFSRLDDLKKEYHLNRTEDDPEKFEYGIDLALQDTLKERKDYYVRHGLRVDIREGIEEDDEEDILDMLPQYLSLIADLEQIIIAQMHTTIDNDLPVNYDRFIKFLENELHDQKIRVPARLEIAGTEESSTQIIYFNTSPEKGIKNTNKNMFIFYRSAPVEESYFRLTLQNPQAVILWQMAGILTSSILLTLLLAGAFIYMFRTIIRQKTDEELKTDFTNNVTHELKTPVSVAMAANEALLSYDQTITEKQKKYLGIIDEQLTRLTGMIEQILSLSVENRSTFRLNIQPVDIKKLFSSVIEQQKLKTDKEIKVTLGIEDHLTVKADKAHLSNIINNLIENAIKYTDGKSIQIHISGGKEPQQTILRITDKGKGITEEHQKRIFDKFYRVPHGNIHNVKGYGLGLYYVKDIMNRHNGQIAVESQPGKGSTFSLIFPN